eukprot:2598063-Prymnesium_polylepis.1
MGRDKYENEELIRYGWPEDLWFHVDKMSSAHVYLRLPPGDTIDDVSMDIVHECAQLTKLNSIEGCKVNNVTIVYTMWANLRKSGDMATGQVSFHKRNEVRSVVIEKRINDIVNRLNKTKEEKHNHPVRPTTPRARIRASRVALPRAGTPTAPPLPPLQHAELAELRAERDARELTDQKAAAKQHHKAEALAREEERERTANQRETVYGMQAVNEEERERLEANLIKVGPLGPQRRLHPHGCPRDLAPPPHPNRKQL